MAAAKRLKAGLLAGAVLIGGIWLVWAGYQIHLRQTTDVNMLIDQLRKPVNKAEIVGHMNRGGIILEYSWPMKKLIALGDAAREPLHQRLDDQQIKNEVVLV